jgi:hypothetical protein
MDLFEDIQKIKMDFPKRKTITDEISTYKFNFYQLFAIGLFILLFVLCIFLGNLFSTCQASSYFYSDTCVATEFNYSVMIFVWFIGTLLSLFIFSIGHIIALLSNINEKLSKFKS